LLLDTGASFTMIHPKIIDNLGYNIDHPLETIKVTGLGSKKTDCPVITTNSFNCIGQKIEPFKVLADVAKIPKELQCDGILGMDFLKPSGVVISIVDSIIASIN
jgi:predicted aspartyl protease